MKLRINKSYILGLMAVGSLFTACSHEDPILFGGESDGYYFNYNSAEDMTATINFADSVVTDPQMGYVSLKVRLLGHLSDNTTAIKFKAEPVEGYEMPEVTLPVAEVKPGEYDTSVKVGVARPTQENTTYAVKITFEQADKSMKDFNSFVIYTKEVYERPDNWTDRYYGEWTAEKFKFCAKTLKNAAFYREDTYKQSNVYNPTLIYAVRDWHKEHPTEAIPYDIPFLDDTEFYSDEYHKPDYWGDLQDKYFGNYNGWGFGKFALNLGVNTQNEYQILGSTDEAELQKSNKNAVLLMLQNYNNQFEQNYNFWGFNSAFSVPMVEGVDYDVVAPAFWTNSLTRPMIEKYYGEYSEAKYKKMLKIASSNVDGFKPFQLFPVRLLWDDASMTNTPMWDTDANLNWTLYGEQVIYEFYKIFKQNAPSLFPDGVTAPADESQEKQ